MHKQDYHYFQRKQSNQNEPRDSVITFFQSLKNTKHLSEKPTKWLNVEVKENRKGSCLY